MAKVAKRKKLKASQRKRAAGQAPAAGVETGTPVSLTGAAQSWTMDYAPALPEAVSPPPLAMVMQAAKSADPTEDKALALWNEGRKEEAIAFLEKQIAEERDAPLLAAAPPVVATPVVATPAVAPPVAETPLVTPVVVASNAAPPIVMPPVVAAQAMSSSRANTRPRFLAASALGLLLVAGGALAWSDRESAEPVLADAGVVQPAQAGENAGAAFMSDTAEELPPVREDQAVDAAEVAPVGAPRMDAPAPEDAFASEDAASVFDDAGESEEIVFAEATAASRPEPREVDPPPGPAAFVLPAEEPVTDEAFVVAESTPPPRIEERAAAASDEQPARQVRQVGENLATEWPASGTGSAPPRIAAPSADDTPPDETVSEAPAVLTEEGVAALTDAESDSEAVEAEVQTEIPAVAEIEEAAPGLNPGAEAGSETVAVTLPLGHFEFSGTASAAAGGATPQLAGLSPLAPSADATGMRTPRARPQPTMAAYQQVPPAEPARTRPRRVVVAEAYDAPAVRQRRQVYGQPPVVYQRPPPNVAYEQALADGYVIIQQDRARYFRPQPGRVYVAPAPLPPPRYEIIGRVPGW